MTGPRRTLLAAAVAMCAGLTAAAFLGGFSTNPFAKLMQTAGDVVITADGSVYA